MAFLTTRIKNNLNDNEMSHSARSLSSISCNSSHLSSRSYDSSMASVRNVNSAQFIENVALLDALSEDNVKFATISETQTDIVPPLDIKSEENYPTTRDYTFSYRKHCDADKIVLKPDKAFETWLSAKRKLLSDEAARRKKEEELKQKEMENRRRLAKEKYEGWLQKKSQSSVNLQSITNNAAKTNTNCETKTLSKPSAEEVRDRLLEWERAKRMQEERRREIKRKEEERRIELEEQRRQMAAEAWEKWVSSADKKPKPVPLNRGIFTLRGTVSEIFVNPNEWKTIIPETNEEN